MRPYLEKHPFIISVLTNLILVVLFYSTFYSRFGTTDDIEMQMVLAGKGVLQEPSAYLRYSHILIGAILSSLYTWWASISWYTYLLVGAHFVGLTALLYTVIKLKANLFRWASYIAFFVIGETILLQELQFTSASLVLQIGGIALLFLSFYSEQPSKRWYVISCLMLLFGSLIRWETFLLAVVLGTPLLLYAIWKNQSKRLVHLGFCIVIIVTAWGLDLGNYAIHNQDEGWKTFHKYKKLGSGQSILDFKHPMYAWTPSTADDYFYKVGWEYEDYELFKRWFFADSSVYGYRQFRALQYSFQDCPLPAEHIEERSWQFFIEYKMQDYVFYGFILLFLAVLLTDTNKGLYLAWITTAGFIFSVLAMLFIYRHLPERVSFPMAFYMMSLAVLFWGYNKNIEKRTKYIMVLFLAFLSLSTLKQVTQRSSKVADDKMDWSIAMDSLNAKPHQLYIGGGDYFMMPLITPFQSLTDSLFHDFNMVDFGHLANTPTFYKQLENFDIDNIHTEAIGDTSIYLIHRYQKSDFLLLYANFIARHYNRLITYETVWYDEKLNVGIYRMLPNLTNEEEKNEVSKDNI